MEKRDTGSFRFLIKYFRRWNEFRDWFASSLDAGVERKTTLYIDLSRSATLKDLVYWLQILFSAGIATLGLVLNSSAVIIGAMLISPLMAPILSAGLSLATGDLSLGVRAVANLFLSTLLGMGFAFLLVASLPYNEQTIEIMARTQPNTLDLVIALFSAAIGAIATCRETKGVVTSIPGVAIAVALMPPLCVVGYGLALGGDGGWKIARGGGLLYLTNLVAITFTAMLVFILLRVDRSKVREAVRAWRENDAESQWWLAQINRIPRLEKAREVRSFTLRIAMIVIPLLIIYVPLSQSFTEVRERFQIQQERNRIKEIATTFWNEAMTGRPATDLDDLRINDEGEKLEVFIRAFSNAEFTQAERMNYLNRLAGDLKRKPSDISLQVIVIPTAQKGDVVAEATPTPATLAELKSSYIQRYKGALAGFRLTTPAELVDFEDVTDSNGRSVLRLHYLSTREIDMDGRAALQNNVRGLLNLPTLTLFLSRISSEIIAIPFSGTGAEFDKENESLLKLIEELESHDIIRARVTLAKNEDNTDLVEERKTSLADFLFKEKSLTTGRVVFTEVDNIQGGNTIQLFIK